ncbi:aminotransferase class I/II-fold pyridoxal phosphate-dependent enzyme [Streptomyces sp. WZ.A104]|uniref:aminotransferase class I/II-fold pyridoxal phosphate-dependent enzyme n=1 Tax=Streptomyces sp. WZ.A104 TaxID=2023771 RepID=UPI00359CB788
MSSNELTHPDVGAVLADALSRVAPEDLRRYPVSGPPIVEVGERLGLAPEEFVLTPGSDVALRAICSYYAATREGPGTLLLQYPNYDAWERQAALSGVPVQRVVTERGDPAQQGEALCTAAELTTGALIAVSVPNGPAGWVLPDETLDRLAALARERGHLLVIDACYQAFDGPVDALLRRRGEGVLVVQTLSKSHGLAGARVAVTCGEPDLVARLAVGGLEETVSGPSLAVARAALADGARYEPIWREVRENREAAARTLREWGLEPLPSGGNFITVRVGGPDRAAAVVARLSEEGYRVRDLSGVSTLEGCVRFTVAGKDVCEDFLTALRAALAASPAEAAAGAPS